MSAFGGERTFGSATAISTNDRSGSGPDPILVDQRNMVAVHFRPFFDLGLHVPTYFLLELMDERPRQGLSQAKGQPPQGRALIDMACENKEFR